MRSVSLTVCTVLVLASASPVDAALSKDARAALLEARTALQDAVNAASIDDILAVRAGVLALDASAQSDPAVRYTILLADWRVAPLMQRAQKPLAEVMRYVDEGIAHAEALEKATPQNAEPYALHSSLLGLKMTSADADMMTLGPRSMALMQKAVKTEPRNPRVAMLDGVQTFFTPAQFGGGAAPALPGLRRAVALFDSTRSTDALAPSWGADDAHVWLAQAQLATGDSTAARASIHRALEKNPHHGWARMIADAIHAGGAR